MEETTASVKKKNPVKIFILGGIALLLIGYGVKEVMFSFTHESTDNAQIETNTIPIVSRVAGYIDSVNLSDYQSVEKGQVLVKIDNRENQMLVASANADLRAAEADLANAKSQLISSGMNKDIANANLEIQELRLTKAIADYQRDQNLYKENSITRKQLDDSKNNFETAQKQVNASRDQVKFASSQINNSTAQVNKIDAQIDAKKTALENADLKLSYTEIVSPVNGKVGKTNLQSGQYVQPGQTLFTLVDNNNFWITANFKETQVAKFKEGMEAIIKVDGLPDVNIKGKITGLSAATGARFSLLPPDNATGNFVKVTQRIPVRIAIENIEEVKSLLKAGMSVKVEIKTN